MTEEDFQSKQHVTKHMTLGRYGMLSEASEVNSAEENDWLNWKTFLAKTLTPDRVSPFVLKQVTDASTKYRKAFKSYAFGVVKTIASRWVLIVIGVVVAVVLMLFLTGTIQVS